MVITVYLFIFVTFAQYIRGIKNNDLDVSFRSPIQDLIMKSKDYTFSNTNQKREKRQLLMNEQENSDSWKLNQHKYDYNSIKGMNNNSDEIENNISGHQKLKKNNTPYNWRANYSSNIKYDDIHKRYNNTGTYKKYNYTRFNGYMNNKTSVMNRSDLITTPKSNTNHHIQKLKLRFNMTSFGYNNPNTGYHHNNVSYSKHTFMPRFNTTRFRYHNHYRVPNYTERNIQELRYGDNNNRFHRSKYENIIKGKSSGYLLHEQVNNKLTGSNHLNFTLKTYAPGYLPIPQFPGYKSGDRSSHWYNNINLSAEPPGSSYGIHLGNNEIATITTENIVSGCNICNIGCPSGRHRSGIFCVLDTNNDY